MVQHERRDGGNGVGCRDGVAPPKAREVASPAPCVDERDRRPTIGRIVTK